MAASRFAGTHLVVMGLRASGKSSAGHLAAERLGTRFEDLDELAIQDVDGRAFSSVSAAFEAAGEAGFRAAEARALQRALTVDRQAVLALGGGTPAFPEAHRVLIGGIDAGVVLGPVYLHASPSVLRQRLLGDAGDRPPLTGRDPADEIVDLYEQRDATYRRLAARIVEVDHLSVDQTADRLLELWHELLVR